MPSRVTTTTAVFLALLTLIVGIAVSDIYFQICGAAAEGSRSCKSFGLEFKLSDFFLVLFTGVLAWKTAGLDAATRGLQISAEEQSRDMKESITVNRVAAEAAKASADVAAQALAATSRAWIFFPGLGFQHEADDTPSLIQFNFKNLGTAPALGLKISYKLWLTDYIVPSAGTELSEDPNKALNSIELETNEGAVAWPSMDYQYPRRLSESDRQIVLEALLARKSLIIDVCAVYLTAGTARKTWVRFLWRDVPNGQQWPFTQLRSGNGAS